MPTTRRRFVKQLGAVAAGMALPLPRWLASVCTGTDDTARVVIGTDEALTRGVVTEHADLLRKLLDASMQRLTGAATAPDAWRTFFKPADRVGLKVNTLGLSTSPAVVDAIVAGLRQADVPAKNIIIWDRFDVELQQAGFTLSRSVDGVRCYGTDAEAIGSGYQREIQTNGQIGSCFSRILAEQVDAVISVPVLKDHSLAGVSMGMKNFYGAIHNPNKYHGDNCDPFIVDVVSHPFVRGKLRLTVCDATRAQYHAGPGRNPGFMWPFGGVLVGSDVVAVDAVAADLIETERKARRLKSLAEEDRAPRQIATANARGLGIGDLARIERIEV